jgi:hypothetical protein
MRTEIFIEPRTSDTVAVIDASPDARIVTMPDEDTFATVVLDDCHAAVLVRSSVVPFESVAIAVNCDCPVATKLDVPETFTLATVGADGVVGVVGVGVGAVGVLPPLEAEQLIDRSNAAATAKTDLVIPDVMQGICLGPLTLISPPMSRVRFLVLTCGIALTLSAPPAQQRLFTFHSNPWLNLHHHLRAGVRGMPAPSGLTPDAQAQWAAAVDFYNSYAQRDLGSDEMRAINDALRSAENRATLDGVAVDTELKATLERMMPVYRRVGWPEQDRVNRAWIAALQPLLDQHGLALSRALASTYETKWPGDPITVDLTPTAGPVGAYTTSPPTHITIASADPSYQGLHALEMVFHESSHSDISNLFTRVRQAAADQNVTVPARLWHGVLFFTAGELTARELKAHGIAYTPYADEDLYVAECGAGCRDKIARYWLPRIDGKQSVADALSALVASFK